MAVIDRQSVQPSTARVSGLLAGAVLIVGAILLGSSSVGVPILILTLFLGALALVFAQPATAKEVLGHRVVLALFAGLFCLSNLMGVHMSP